MTPKNAFKATYKDQYVQDVNLKKGVYTFQARVFFSSNAIDGKYSISFKDEVGGVYNINLNWQVEPNKWCSVTQVLEFERTMVEFSLMASTLSSNEYILIGLPQHEEGETKSTPRPNPLDEREETENEIDLVRSFISSEVEFLEDRITLKVGEYRVGGRNFLRNFDGRFGMEYWGTEANRGFDFYDENGEPLLLEIESVIKPKPVKVLIGATPTLPATVKLVLEDESTTDTNVVWETINTSEPKEVEVEGTYELPIGVVGNKPEVFITILIAEA